MIKGFQEGGSGKSAFWRSGGSGSLGTRSGERLERFFCLVFEFLGKLRSNGIGLCLRIDEAKDFLNFLIGGDRLALSLICQGEVVVGIGVVGF